MSDLWKLVISSWLRGQLQRQKTLGRPFSMILREVALSEAANPIRHVTRINIRLITAGSRMMSQLCRYVSIIFEPTWSSICFTCSLLFSLTIIWYSFFSDLKIQIAMVKTKKTIPQKYINWDSFNSPSFDGTDLFLRYKTFVIITLQKQNKNKTTILNKKKQPPPKKKS